MANTPDINKKQVGLRLDLELCQKVEKHFTRDGDKNAALAYVRALEEATRKVKLDLHDLNHPRTRGKERRQKERNALNELAENPPGTREELPDPSP